MSAYPRRGVNVSQFLANGNTISPTEASLHDTDDDFATFHDDLAKYTNLGEFKEIDFNTPAFGGHDGSGIDFSVPGGAEEQQAGEGQHVGGNSKKVKMEKARQHAAATAAAAAAAAAAEQKGPEFASGAYLSTSVRTS